MPVARVEAMAVLATTDIKPYPNYCFFIQAQVVVRAGRQAVRVGPEVLAVTAVVAVAVARDLPVVLVDMVVVVWL
jgi:hypothetical protein